MQSLDIQVLEDALGWCRQGRKVDLVTVVQTWGSAPRPVGSIAAIREDGLVTGSVSGGCIETDLIARVQHGVRLRQPAVLTYGVTRDEAAGYGLPCGGTLRLVQEPIRDSAWIAPLLHEVQQHRLTRRVLDLPSGVVTLGKGHRGDAVAFDGSTLAVTFGPRWRLLLIGAGQLSRAVAGMASALDFEVLVCDPREEYSFNVDSAAMRLLPGMPDDVVREIRPDAHTAIVALTHDPKLDDMALLEALASDAFYVGALGSARSTEARRARLRLFDLQDAQIDRLHGPVGLKIGSRTPAEIAVSILAEIISVKNNPPPVEAARPVESAEREDLKESLCRFAIS
jgi:xanthine dehydrogenase accessory factor